jgi:hypothetical protein
MSPTNANSNSPRSNLDVSRESVPILLAAKTRWRLRHWRQAIRLSDTADPQTMLVSPNHGENHSWMGMGGFMSEAPTRFWIDPKREGGPWPSNDSVEYVRADIVEEMRQKLNIAAQVFRVYQAHHEAKGDEKKADRNRFYAEQMEAALKLLEDQE